MHFDVLFGSHNISGDTFGNHVGRLWNNHVPHYLAGTCFLDRNLPKILPSRILYWYLPLPCRKSWGCYPCPCWGEDVLACKLDINSRCSICECGSNRCECSSSAYATFFTISLSSFKEGLPFSSPRQRTRASLSTSSMSTRVRFLLLI